MSYEKKEWKDRIAEYPTRRQLEKSDGSSELVTVSRAEGNISQEGDAFSAENMNALEKRISNGFEEVNAKITNKVLWVNDNPSSAFPIQTITLNSDDYDVLDIYYRDSANSPTTVFCVSAMKGYNADLMRTGGAHHTETIIVRTMEYVNDTTLKFQACYSSGSGNTPVNSINVPIKIVGRKSI